MQPPEPISISDSVSVATSDTTDISLAYGQSTPGAQSIISQYRGSSVLSESPRLAPQDSISQQLPTNQALLDEEAILRQEIADLERKQRIQALQKRKEELLRNLHS